MNIALTTVVVVAALIPSIAFLNSYYVGQFPRQLTGLSPLSELALYFLWALPIDAAALYWGGVVLERSMFDLVVTAIGLRKADASLDPLFEYLHSGGGWIWLSRYLLTVMIAVLAGSILRRVVWASRLDLHVPLLRLKAEWYYLILGRKSGIPRNILPQADVLVRHPDSSEGSRLYVGVVSGFEASRDGGIEQLYLSLCQRYRKGEGGEWELKNIPGDRFAISGPTIHSINMRYFEVEPVPAGRWRRFAWTTRNFFAALWEAP